MEPMLSDGELLLVRADGEVGTGDMVVCRHPYKKIDIVKLVRSVDDDGYLALSSPGGTDSDQFGRVPASLVRGRVTANASKRRIVAASGR